LKIRRDRRKLDPSPMTRYARRAAAEFNNQELTAPGQAMERRS